MGEDRSPRAQHVFFQVLYKTVLHIRNIWRLLEVLTPQCHPRPAESEYVGVSLTVEWRLGTQYHLKQEDNIACFSEIDMSCSECCGGGVGGSHAGLWGSKCEESANEFMDLFVAVLTRRQNLGLTLVCSFDTQCWQGLSSSWSF